MSDEQGDVEDQRRYEGRCPKCGSRNVLPGDENIDENGEPWEAGVMCMDCPYSDDGAGRINDAPFIPPEL